MSDQAPPPPPPPPPGGTPPPPPPAPGGPPVAAGFAPDGRPYAEWIWRVIAYVIDEVIPWVVALIGWIVAGALTTSSLQTTTVGGYQYTTVSRGTSGVGFAIAAICYIIAALFYLWNKGYREGTTGKSIGKQMTGYTTVKESTNEPLGAGMGILRCILLIVDFWICYIGVLWPLWDAKRQCLISDKATGAVVFKD